MDPAAKLAHKLQKAWLELVAMKQHKEAIDMSHVVDALFDNDPSLAIRHAQKAGMDDRLISSIREVFGLTPD